MLERLLDEWDLTLKELGIRILAFVILMIVAFFAFSYGSSALLLYMHNVPLSQASFFRAWDYLEIYRHHPAVFIRLSVTFCAYLPILLSLLLLPLSLVIIRGNGRALHGDARFATRKEIVKAGLLENESYDKTILVGKSHGEYLSYGGYQFVILAAPTRSGKGVGVVVPNCLNYSDSLVVLDIKYENFEITSGYRAAHGQEIYLFAPFDENGRTHRYNPLEYISDDPASRMGDIDAIANALYNNPNSKDKFFDEQAKDLFRGICMMVLENPKLPKTMGEILRQSSGYGKSIQEHLSEMIEKAEKEGHPYSSACVDAINRVISLSPNTFAGVKGSLQVPLLIFANPRVDAATSANDFDLRDVRKKRMSIYLGITPDKLADAANIINLFFDQLLNLNCRKLPTQDPSLKYQCLMILDEFTAIGKVNMIAKSISYQAGYNMRVLTIIQNKSQLEDVYGKAGAVTIMSNHALMVMYAPSPTVQQDANEYSEMLGYQTVHSKSKSKSFGRNVSKSQSISDQRRALMLPQELRELGPENEIVNLENCKPIKCNKIRYYLDENFKERCNMAIPDIPVLDIDHFVAKIEDRRRDLQASDLQQSDAKFTDNVAGSEDIPSVDEIVENTNESRKAAAEGGESISFADYQSFFESAPEEAAEETARAIIRSVVRNPIDREKFKQSEENAQKSAELLMSESSLDDDSDGIELVEMPKEKKTETVQSDSGDDLLQSFMNAANEAIKPQKSLASQAKTNLSAGTIDVLASFGFEKNEPVEIVNDAS